jgi:hypothetical protein
LGRQNHTSSPFAKNIVRRARIAPDILRPSHPAPNVRDDRDTPLNAGGETAGENHNF